MPLNSIQVHSPKRAPGSALIALSVASYLLKHGTQNLESPLSKGALEQDIELAEALHVSLSNDTSAKIRRPLAIAKTLFENAEFEAPMKLANSTLPAHIKLNLDNKGDKVRVLIEKIRAYNAADDTAKPALASKVHDQFTLELLTRPSVDIERAMRQKDLISEIYIEDIKRMHSMADELSLADAFEAESQIINLGTRAIILGHTTMAPKAYYVYDSITGKIDYSSDKREVINTLTQKLQALPIQVSATLIHFIARLPLAQNIKQSSVKQGAPLATAGSDESAAFIQAMLAASPPQHSASPKTSSNSTSVSSEVSSSSTVKVQPAPTSSNVYAFTSQPSRRSTQAHYNDSLALILNAHYNKWRDTPDPLLQTLRCHLNHALSDSKYAFAMPVEVWQSKLDRAGKIELIDTFLSQNSNQALQGALQKVLADPTYCSIHFPNMMDARKVLIQDLQDANSAIPTTALLTRELTGQLGSLSVVASARTL